MTGASQNVAWLDTPCAADARTLAVVTEAVVPLVVWPNVTVRRAVEQKLTTIERFLIEVALRLGDLTTQDLAELISLPTEATDRIAGRLCSLGVLEAQSDRYLVCEHEARTALQREVLVEYHDDRLTFIVLPRTDDVLAFENKRGRPQPPKVHRLKPVGKAPMPLSYREKARGEVLQDYAHGGRIAGMPDDVVAIVGDLATEIGETCPTYRAAGQLRSRDGVITAATHLFDEGRREQLDFGEAAGIVEYWLSETNLAATPERFDQIRAEITGKPNPSPPHLGLPDQFTRPEPICWIWRMYAQDAESAVSRGRALSGPGGLQLSSRDPRGPVTTECVIEFEPADGPAARVFALDLAVSVIASAASVDANSIGVAIADACSAHRLASNTITADDVLDALWRRGHHKLIYQLRETEDFSYA